MGTRRRAAAEHEPERPGSARAPGVRRDATGPAQPVLGLQATAGNAAVTSLLLQTGAVSIQRLRDNDDEDENAQGDDSTDGAAQDDRSGATATDTDTRPADATSIDAAQSKVEADLDPATVTDQLAAFATRGGDLGDFETPDTGGTVQALLIQRDPPDGADPGPRPGGPGDVLKALMPFLQPALDRLLANVKDAFAKLKTGEKIAATIVIAPILIAPLTQPGPRRLALDQLDGTDVTFGVIPNLQLKPSISDGQLRGGTLTYDLAPALRGLGLPF